MDTKEYERFVTKYLDCIYRVALNCCKNSMDAEDIVQNAFMKLYESKEHFEEDERVKYWLIRVVINESNSLWRSAWKRRITPLEQMSQEPIFTAPEKSNLYYAMKELPTKCRQILHLYYYEDYSVKEIAAIMKLSETAVQTRLFRARQKLKTILKEVDL